MKHHITFRGLTTSPTDHEAHDGSCATLTNLIAEDDALRTVGITTEIIGTTGSGVESGTEGKCAAVATHRTADYTHLITEVSDGAGRWLYAWTDAEGSHPITTLEEKARTIANIGHTLCLITETAITYCIWQPQEEVYAAISRDDLLYDIHLTQDDNLTREASVPISSSIASWLDHPDQLQAGRHTVLSQVFPHFYDSEEAYATAATMVAAQMEEACDRMAATLGEGTFRHVCFGIAALRLTDGSHLLFSNLFALLPATISPTITADRENGILSMATDFHRHVITVTMRQPERAAHIVRGIDIFLTRPTQFLDMRKAIGHTADGEGRTTSLTFGELPRQSLIQLLDELAFYPAMTITIPQSGSQLLVQNADYGATPIDLGDLRRWSAGAQVSLSHNGRILLGATTAVVHNPMEIGIRYRYGALTVGDHADSGDNPDGITADLITHAVADGAPDTDLWWHSEVAYPIAGMMMTPGARLRTLEYHLRLPTDGGYRYLTTSQTLHPLTRKDLSLAVFGVTGQLHRTPRPLFLSLLWQQVRTLVADPLSGGYAEGQLLWQEETAADYAACLQKVRERWPLNSDETLMRASEQGNPYVFPTASSVSVGDSAILAITSSTRRSADGLFGDGQYYVLNSDGAWLLRLSGGRWSAQQKTTRVGMLPGTQTICTSDAVVYLSAQGVTALKGSTATCLSDVLREPPFRFSSLPYANDIIATERTLPAVIGKYPYWMGAMLREARIAWDAATDRLWLVWPMQRQPLPVPWPGALVYSFRSGAWGSAVARLSSVVCDGSEVWATIDVDAATMVARVRLSPTGRQPVLLCTRPLSVGKRYVHKSVERILVRGLFNHRGNQGSHVGVALYGSNDLHNWHLVSSSMSQYLCCRRGTPYRWFRIAAVGQLLLGESLEGATMQSSNKI